MVSSLPLLFCDSPVSVKENPDRKKSVAKIDSCNDMLRTNLIIIFHKLWWYCNRQLRPSYTYTSELIQCCDCRFVTAQFSLLKKKKCNNWVHPWKLTHAKSFRKIGIISFRYISNTSIYMSFIYVLLLSMASLI